MTPRTNPPQFTDHLLLIPEVAKQLRTTEATVRYWIATGKLASLRPGRRVLIRASEVERFLAEGAR
jgi:excisionase family DNA binding protein